MPNNANDLVGGNHGTLRNGATFAAVTRLSDGLKEGKKMRRAIACLAMWFVPIITVCTHIYAQTPPVTNVIVIWKENRSFDHYLGFLSAGVPPVYTCSTPPTDCVDGLHLDGRESNPTFASIMTTNCLMSGFSGQKIIAPETQYCTFGPSQNWDNSHKQYNGGLNNGFAITDPDTGDRAMKYYTNAQLPYYYNLARVFAVGDKYFSSVLGPSFPNRTYWWRATSCTSAENIQRCPDSAPTVIDLLGQGATFFNYSMSYPVNPTAKFFTDLTNGQLPNVSYIECDGSCDEHPGGNITQGQYVTARIINAVFASDYWTGGPGGNPPPRVAIFIAYDEAGGYYDHVPPPAACPPCSSPATCPADCFPCRDCPAYDGPPYISGNPGVTCQGTGDNFTRYGFRVPFLVISPWVKRHFVSHVTYDHTSLLRFFRYKWPNNNYPNGLTDRDGKANNLLDFFDFTRPNPDTGNIPLPQVCDCTGICSYP